MIESFASEAPIDVLMTTRGQPVSDDPDGCGSLVMNHLCLTPNYPAAPEMHFETTLNALTAGAMPGSLYGRMPKQLYVFSRGKTPEKPLDMAQLHYTKSLFIVSNRVREVLESLPIPNSEFYPVSMVYSSEDIEPDDWGGGPVVANTHWLWWCYSVYDLVDVDRTSALLTPQTEPNYALQDHPAVSFHHVGQLLNAPPINVALKHVPYGECAAFRVLGWSSADMIVSPAFVNAFTASGLIDPDGPILISALPLDGARYAKAEVDFRKKTIPSKPPLRIFGTEMIAADRHDPPFHARRSPLFPIVNKKI